MLKNLFDPPLLVKKYLSDCIWKTSNDQILLTFDDAPSGTLLEKILFSLEQQVIRAVFFCVGEDIKRSPEQFKMIINHGHTIGNHTWNHTSLLRQNESQIISQIERTNKIIIDEGGIRPVFFRPPYGRINRTISQIVKSTGLSTIMWSLLTFDYKNDLKVVKFSIKHYLKSDSIVIFHNNIKSESIIIEALNYIYEQANEKKYLFGDPAKCLK